VRRQFQPPRLSPAAAVFNRPQHVDIYFVRDIDQDGDLDLETTYQKPSGDIKVAFFRNNGDGTFEYNEPIEPVKWKGPKHRWAF
jgi:hypothetical protein